MTTVRSCPGSDYLQNDPDMGLMDIKKVYVAEQRGAYVTKGHCTAKQISFRPYMDFLKHTDVKPTKSSTKHHTEQT